jgi:S-formylglutathione hydrolase FrmB
MSLFSWGIQGHEPVTKQAWKQFKDTFTTYLPGWAVDLETNYSAAPSTQAAGVQLNRIMQSGGHSWYNTALNNLLGDLNKGLRLR